MNKSLTVSAEALRTAFNRVKGSVASKSSMPVLSNVLLSVKQDVLTLASNNLEVSSIATALCQSDEDWAITVPAKLLGDWVSTIKGDITLSFDEVSQTLIPKAGKSKIEIKGIDADEFPSIEPKQAEQVLSIQGWVFSEALLRVIHAAAKDGTASNPVLSGVLVRVKNNVLTVAAVDGYRLNVQYRELEENTSTDFEVIVPSSALATTVLGNIPKNEHDKLLQVSLVKSNSDQYGQIGFTYGDATYYARIIDGKYVDYERFVPPASDAEVYLTVSVAELKAALKRISLTAQAGGNIVTLALKGDDGNYLDIVSKAAEIGNSQEVVSASTEKYQDGKIIAVNILYIQEALNTIPYDNLLMRIATPNAPLVLHSPNQAEGVALVMPMRIP